MGLFRRKLRGLPPDWQPNCAPGWHRGNEWRQWDPPHNTIVGESNYQKAIRKAVGGGKPRKNGYLVPVEVRLVREPKNKHDRNAVKAEVDGRLVGYLRRDLAKMLAPQLDSLGLEGFQCCGLIRGGGTRTPDLGVHIWIGRRSTVGPPIAIGGPVDEVEVRWPPSEHEGTA